MSALDRFFFTHVPTPVRRLFWWFARRNPWCKKRYSGTIGLTSLQMFGSGVIYPIVISPMTTTLAVGSVTKKPVVVRGKIVVRDILHCVLSADHDVVDGGTAVSGADTYRKLVEAGSWLPEPGDADTAAPTS